jgi:hypothetical protein
MSKEKFVEAAKIRTQHMTWEESMRELLW